MSSVQDVHRPEVAEGFKNTGGIGGFSVSNSETAKQTTTNYTLPKETGMSFNAFCDTFPYINLKTTVFQTSSLFQEPTVDAGFVKSPHVGSKAPCSPNLREQR